MSEVEAEVVIADGLIESRGIPDGVATGISAESVADVQDVIDIPKQHAHVGTVGLEERHQLKICDAEMPKCQRLAL